MNPMYAWTIGAILLVSAFVDFRTRRIPNFLTLGGAAVGMVLHAVEGYRAGGGRAALLAAASAVGAGLVVALIPYWSYRARSLGGGDVKLFFAVGVLCGVWGGLLTYIGTYSLLFLVLAGRIVVNIMKKRYAFARKWTPLAPFIAAAYGIVALAPALR